jgi:hypothetical protein
VWRFLGGLGPTAYRDAVHQKMTMYVDLLSAALAGGSEVATTTEALFAAAVICRDRMLHDRRGSGRSAEGQLASEVDYDRSLIHFCTALGIEAGPGHFARPAHERARLEQALAAAGESLSTVGLGQGWRPD